MSRLIRLIPLILVLGCRSCEEAPPEPEMTLTEAADEATFASVEKLGPHRCTSTITRVDSRDGVAGAAHVEVAEISWRDWDRFRLSRVMDGEPVSDVIVVGGKPWAREYDGPWDARDDAEIFRVQLQSTWDSWDTALEPFGERITFTEVGRELIEGRWAHRFSVSLAPDPAAATTAEGAPPKKEKKKERARRASFTPLTLTGTVWIDEISAVRLLAEVEGQVKQGNLVRSISLKLARSAFGEDLNIDPPPKEARAKPSAPEQPPERPSAQRKKPAGR